MASVVIAAHNEAAVIGRCLEALAQQTGPGDLDITVVANGCVDATAAVAREYGARVIELSTPGKALALAAGDTAAVGFPRIYIDADMELPPHAVEATEHIFAREPAVLAAAPRRRMTTAGCSLLVRGYVAVHQRLPGFENSLFGRGMIALSERGRAEFDTFPPMIADDLFLDSLYSAAQKRQINSVEMAVAAPRRSAALLRRLIRVRRGNAELRGHAELRGGAGTGARRVRPADRSAWLTAVVLPHPHLLPAGVVYATMTVTAAVLARAARRDPGWGRDETTRTDAGRSSGKPRSS